MTEKEQKHGFMETIKTGFGYMFQFIFSQITEGSKIVMNNIDDRIVLIEERIFKKICSLFMICFGGIFLILALLFFLLEYVGWSKVIAFFSIGITVFVIGIMLKLGASRK